MGVLGIIIGLIWVVSLLGFLMGGDLAVKQLKYWLPILAVWIFLVGWDAGSPVETTIKVIYTNDFDQYNLNIEGSKILPVKITTKDATRWGATIEDTTKYTLIIED